MEQTKKLAEFCAKVTYNDLPKEVVKIAKHTILETLGCAKLLFPPGGILWFSWSVPFPWWPFRFW